MVSTTHLPRIIRSLVRLHFEWTLRIHFFFEKRGVKIFDAFHWPNVESQMRKVVWHCCLALLSTNSQPFFGKVWACLVNKGFCTQFWKTMQKWEMFAFELCVNHLWTPPNWTQCKPPLNWCWAVLDDCEEPPIAVLTNKLELILFWF
jgi:hypothetical protein